MKFPKVLFTIYVGNTGVIKVFVSQENIIKECGSVYSAKEKKKENASL